MQRIKNILLCVVFTLLIGGLTAWFWLKGENGYSESERRELAKFPEFTVETIDKGTFMSEFETYSRDRFPARDAFRSIKALSEYYIFGNSTNNGYYLHDGHISKTEYPMQSASIDNAVQKIQNICDKFILPHGTKVYFSLIPDKNAFLAQDADVVSMDYEKFRNEFVQKLPDVQHIDISGLLSSEDFYYTDQHWKQECVTDVANAISTAMGNPLSESFEQVLLDNPFYGTYHSQAAVPHKPDTIYYLTNDMIKGCTVTSLDTGVPAEAEMYDMKKAYGRDPYEMFLCGSQAIIRIDNPNADTDKKLVVFRDSFGSSLAPLMVESYSSITLVDIRYIMNSNFLNSFIDFSEFDDALFMYCTLLMNNSSALK